MANQLTPAQAIELNLLQIQYEIQFVNYLRGTFSGNFNTLGNTLQEQLAAQQTDLQNQANALQRRLAETSDDGHDLEGEVMRLRDVTYERLTQIRLSVARRLGKIEQIHHFIERNTQDIYRVLALLA
jgi:archaellum component FlaC